MAKRIALVDADALLYLAGFAAQKTVYECVLEKEDTAYQAFFSSAAAIKDHLQETGATVLERVSVSVPEPVEFALAICKDKMLEMRNRYTNLEVYLKGDGVNWRDQVATLHGYKANRTAAKPVHMEAIRQYLIANWKAIPVNGKEADDQIATRAHMLAIEPVICSVDKDLDQIPGLHWNYGKNVEYRISEQEALDFFYQQVLSGDYADNVHGCWRLGEKRARELVSQVREECESCPTDFELLMWKVVLSEYELSVGKEGCPYAGMPIAQVALENARLVWMQSESRMLWTPPGEPLCYLDPTLDD